MKNTKIILSSFLIALISSSSFAQVLIPNKTNLKTNVGKVQNLSTQSVSISHATGVSNEYLVSATNNTISNAPALSDFRLWFNNGDHMINTIGILHEQGAMRAIYKDQNGDDPFRVDAKWINIPGATGGTISAAGAGTFNIQLPPKPADTTIVISGFSFARAGGTDNNIRTMSIKIDQQTSIAQVSFLDDQREDYRSIVEPTMTGGVLGLVPFGTIFGSYISMESIIRGIINDGKNTARPYGVTLQYAFVPNSRIAANGATSGTSRIKAEMQGQSPDNKPIAYRGFVLRFNNSDHHLLGIGLHLNGLPAFPGQRPSFEEPITWQDNNRDDGIQWYVEYSSIK